MKSIFLNGKEHKLSTYRGKVLAANKDSRTYVSGGGSVNNGNGSTSVTSEVVTYDDLFLSGGEGEQEKSFRLRGFDVSCRTGNEVSVVSCLTPKGKEPYIAVVNHSTGQIFYQQGVLYKMCKAPSGRHAVVFICAFIASAFIHRYLSDVFFNNEAAFATSFIVSLVAVWGWIVVQKKNQRIANETLLKNAVREL